MSEESKTPEGDYVMMGGGTGPSVSASTSIANQDFLNDPSLSQEDKDHRLAIRLQQEENAAVYDAHKKRHENIVQASTNRTARSGTFTKLAAIRDKDHGMLQVPKDYTTENAYVKNEGSEYVGMDNKSDAELLQGATPQQVADFQLAKQLQKVEQAGAGTAREMDKIVKEEKSAEESQAHRTGYSNYHINQKKMENLIHKD